MPLEVAEKVGRQTRAQQAQELGANAVALPKNGEIGRGRNSCYNVTPSERGNSAAYLARRLRRDAPVFADALARREYPSVQAACRAAGIVVPRSLEITL